MKRTKDNWKQIEETNKAMARFLGYEYFPLKQGIPNQQPGWKKSDDHPVHEKLFSQGIGKHYLCRVHKELKFHSDWNWLMAVVEKLLGLGYEFRLDPAKTSEQNLLTDLYNLLSEVVLEIED